jgi:hypothetical protein
MDTLFVGGVVAADTAADTLVERNLVDDSYGLPAFESDGDRVSGPTPPPRPSSRAAPTSDHGRHARRGQPR